MGPTLRGHVVLLLAALALAGTPSGVSAQTPTEQRESAILKSRAGQKAEGQYRDPADIHRGSARFGLAKTITSQAPISIPTIRPGPEGQS